MFFYELHEGDNEVYSDLLLVHDSEFTPEEFFELVQSIRPRVQDAFEEDTLIEAIAGELEREHGFTFVSDSRLSASVNVSKDEDENYLTPLEREIEEDEEFRTVYADFDPDAMRD